MTLNSRSSSNNNREEWLRVLPRIRGSVYREGMMPSSSSCTCLGNKRVIGSRRKKKRRSYCPMLVSRLR